MTKHRRPKGPRTICSCRECKPVSCGIRTIGTGSICRFCKDGEHRPTTGKDRRGGF